MAELSDSDRRPLRRGVAHPVTRDYTPTIADLRTCAACGEVCFPFPRQDSPLCSACWYTSSGKVRQNEKEAR